MNFVRSAFWVHGLHLSSILLLGYFVWQDRCRDGEARLFKAIYVTQGFAREQMKEAHEKTLDLIRWQTEAFSSTRSLDDQDRVARIALNCDSVIALFNGIPLVQTDRVLQLLHDSLSANIKDEPVFYTQIDTLLLRSHSPDVANLLSKARARQQLMFCNDLQINILLSKEQVLNYFMRRVWDGSCGFVTFDCFWVPNVICPMANESFGVTAFIGVDWGYYMHPKSATVWLNGASIPVKNGKAPFSVRFVQPGPQQMTVRVETRGWGNGSDTLRVFEKNYTVHVK